MKLSSGTGLAVLLVTIALLAGALNGPAARGPGLRFIYGLAQYEAFHILAHLVLFGLVAVAATARMGDRPAGPKVLLFVIAGTALIETVQLLTVAVPVTTDSVRASMLDLTVNACGALLGLGGMRLFRGRSGGVPIRQALRDKLGRGPEMTF